MVVMTPGGMHTANAVIVDIRDVQVTGAVDGHSVGTMCSWAAAAGTAVPTEASTSPVPAMVVTSARGIHPANAVVEP